MAKTAPSLTIKAFELISKGAIYLLVFLLPLLFLPWTANTLDFNKQALLMVLVFISLFAWILKVLISGKISFNLVRFHILIGVSFLIFLFSTLFSLWRYGSFWGWPLSTSESLLSLICLLLFYLLVVNVFEKKEIPYLMALLVFSGFFVMLFGFFQLFGKFLMPWVFTKTSSFNTIGSVNKLGLFSAILLPLIIVLLIESEKRFWRAIFIITLVLDIVLLALVNFSIVWWMVLVAAGLIMAFGMPRGDFFDNRWLILPMFLLAVSLFFIFFRLQIPGVPSRPVEIFLTHRTSFDIVWQTLKERPILGSGPGTFVYDFSKYKSISFNHNPFWNVRFDAASSKILNISATTGILGILSMLSLMGVFVFYGIKFLFRKKGRVRASGKEALKEYSPETEQGVSEEFSWMLSMGIFVGFGVLCVGYFLYNSNLTLDFIFFLLMGSFISLLSPAKKDFLLKPSSLLTLSATFIFTLAFIFGLGLFILEGQRYTAEVSYLQGVETWQQGRTDEALNSLEKAARISPRTDLYWRELSQVYLQRINIEAARTDLPREQISQGVQLFINKAVNSAKTATDVNSRNVANWSVRGFIYQNLIGVVGGVKDWAVKSYDEALKLEPTNPYYPAQAGIALLRELVFLSPEEAGGREKLLSEAGNQFKKAIELKSDYAPARFQLAMVYQAQGRTEEAIEELEKTMSLAPFDVGLAFQLGLVYYQNKDYRRAQLELERAVGIDPNYANALYFLGLTYDQQGEKVKAIEKFERVLQLNPGNEEIQQILGNLETGKEALEGIVEEVPPTIPIEETPPELEEEE